MRIFYPEIARGRRPWVLLASAPIVFGAALYGLWLVAQRAAPSARPDDSVGLEALLAEMPDGGFETISGPWQPVFPRDHGAHQDGRMETWSLAAHLADGDGDLGIQFSLLRVGLAPPSGQQRESPWHLQAVHRAHLILLRGPEQRLVAEERFSRGTPGVVGDDDNEVWLDDWSLATGPADDLRLRATVDGNAIELALTPVKDAVVANEAGEGPFRGYAMTRMSVQASLGEGSTARSATGVAWLEHAWGDLPLPGGPIAWDRLQLQLDDGTDIGATRARRREGGGTPTVEAYVVDASGKVEAAALRMEPSRVWRHEDVAYPVEWHLVGDEIDLRVTPPLDGQLQDFVTPFWNGIVTAEGEVGGRPVKGTGTLQLTGYEAP